MVSVPERGKRGQNKPIQWIADGAACKSSDWCEAASAGDDLEVVADYGGRPIEDLTAHQVFSPQRLAHAYAQSAKNAPMREGHT
jgi:hypothetical protein